MQRRSATSGWRRSTTHISRRQFADIRISSCIACCGSRGTAGSPTSAGKSSMRSSPKSHGTRPRRERRADDAERELLQWKKVRFMADKVGDEFHGYITGVAPYGLFVELIEHFVEGLVHISSMADDYYRFVEQQHTLRRREHEAGLSARRRGPRAGGARRHGATAGRSGSRRDSRSRSSGRSGRAGRVGARCGRNGNDVGRSGPGGASARRVERRGPPAARK